MSEQNHPAAARENILIGLTLVGQLFSPTAAIDIAHDAVEAYPDNTYEMATSMLAAALMIIQDYAQQSGESIGDTINGLRQRILNNEIDLPPMP